MTDEDAVTPPYGTAMPLKARPRWRSLVIGLAVGLVIGAGGVTLAWSITDQQPSDAAADAEATCALTRRTAQTEPGDKFADYGRWIAASALAKIAAGGDPQYKPLEDAAFDAAMIVGRTYEAAGPDFEREARKVRELCDKL
jgi:hypothetical protein